MNIHRTLENVFVSMLIVTTLGVVQAHQNKLVFAAESCRIELPAGYTKSRMKKASKGKASSDFIVASIKGMRENHFKPDESENNEMVQPGKLTNDQKKELGNFALDVINSARQDLNLSSWRFSQGTQKLADDITKQYNISGRSIADGQHYIAGITLACKQNGLMVNDNYVEDMTGFSEDGKMSMSEVKSTIYFGIKQMIFGYVGGENNDLGQRNYYQEWHHAGDLLNADTTGYNYFGFNISQARDIYSVHYISVPKTLVNNKSINKSFRP